MNEWISCNDFLPDEGQMCIVTIGDNSYRATTVAFFIKSQWYSIIGSELMDNVIAWRLLPIPYSGE